MINVKEDIIDKALLDKCLNYVNEGNWSYGWHSNKNVQFGHWNLNITKTSAHNSTDVVDRLPKQFKPVWDIINKEFFGGQAMLTRCYSNRHTFGTEGYIHTDTTRAQDHTCVVYLDEEWDSDWGGETNFYTADRTEIIKSVLPKYGRTAVFPGTVPHCARSITRICSKVRTTLMFKATIDPKALYPAEEMLKTFLTQIGATQRKHRTGTLADHLMRCFHLLKEVGANDIVALAGGLHSVYGTNAFKHPCIDKKSTQIKDLFGSEIDRLIRLYSELDRPSCLENPDGSLSELDLFLLRSIECVNLYDQDALKADKYPNLLKFVKQLTGRG